MGIEAGLIANNPDMALQEIGRHGGSMAHRFRRKMTGRLDLSLLWRAGCGRYRCGRLQRPVLSARLAQVAPAWRCVAASFIEACRVAGVYWKSASNVCFDVSARGRVAISSR
jgi:hypothetical protein